MDMRRWALVGGEVVTPYRSIPEGVVLGTAGLIDFVGSMEDDYVLEGREVRDTSDCIVAPGFVDIHLHGGDGADFMDGSLDAFRLACACHARGGTTSLIPTTVAFSINRIVETLALVEEAMETRLDGAQVLGAHMEGPWFASAKKGAHDEVWDPRQDELAALLEWTHVIKRLTLAPELTGAMDATQAMSEAGVLVCAGHTDATYAEMVVAMERGLSHVTHLWNQTSSVSKKGPYRRGGCVEAALLEDGLTVELIADGHHLPPELMRLALKCKDVDRVCIVTDATRGTGMPEGTTWAAGPKDSKVKGVIQSGVSVLPDGTAFAGSVATMDRLVRNAVTQIGLPLTEAIRIATSTPAQIVAESQRKGSLAPGKDADIVVLDRSLNVFETIVLGETVYRASKD